MTAPRPGSTIDRAQRALQSGPLPRAELARLIERDEDELDGLLRYGVRMGLLVRSNGDEDVTYALGTGEPVELEARPAPAEPAAPAAPARPAPSLTVTPAELEGLPPGVLAELRPRRIDFIEPPALVPPPPAPRPERWPGGFRTRPGSNAHRMLQLLAEVAPAGGVRWLSSRDLGAATGVDVWTVGAFMAPAVRGGAVAHRLVGPGRGSSEYQMGADDREQAAAAAPVAEHTVPAPAPAAPAAAPAAPRPAPPEPGPAPADEHAAALLRHLDAEIDRMRRALGELARRREQVEMVVVVKGARLAPPQSGQAMAAASVRSAT